MIRRRNGRGNGSDGPSIDIYAGGDYVEGVWEIDPVPETFPKWKVRIERIEDPEWNAEEAESE